MKNIVFFGGGTGLSSILKGIKEIQDINISAIVTVADSGGSTGILRKEYNVPALGDIRQVLISLSNKEDFLNQLMKYRFEKNPDAISLKDHSLGNLIIYSFIDIKNSFYDGIHYLSEIFKITGEIIPVTDYAKCELRAFYTDGTFMDSEDKIPSEVKKIDNITYCDIEKINVNPLALHAINNADVIVFSCGSLYTSVIANLALPQIKNALILNKEKAFVYISNIVTQPNETRDMDALDHIKEIEKYLQHGIIDAILMNNTKPLSTLVDKYKNANSKLILPDERIYNSHCSVYEASLIDDSNLLNIRHDYKKLKKLFIQYLKEI